MDIVLPQKDKEGNYYISYSQINSWNAIKGYNTGLPGEQEYIRHYFCGETDPSGPFAEFGTQVEDYITTRTNNGSFTNEETTVLNKIKPLGIFQHECKLQYDGFYVKSLIDDATPDFTHLRDYKTASNSSRAKYLKPDYMQLDIYALGIQQEFGLAPKKLEVCVIERTGNGYKFGRDVLKVGGSIWYVPIETTAERLAMVEKYILTAVHEISDVYKVFLKLNK